MVSAIRFRLTNESCRDAETQSENLKSCPEVQKRRESGISRVLFSTAAKLLGGQLSIWDICYQMPLAVLFGGTGKRPTVVPTTLLPTGVYRASTSRCCWCALTAPLHPYPQQSMKGKVRNLKFHPSSLRLEKAVCFCGTILTVTRTGRYPASLAFREPGLSSDSTRTRVRNCLRLLSPNPV